jgi:outer membrane protein TolC
MKNKFLLTAGISFLLSVTLLSAQEKSGEIVLNLKDAQSMALKNNYSVISARLDQESAKLSVNQTISGGLPQVNLSGSFADNLKLMTTLLPGEFFGKPGEKIPVTFGSKFNTSSAIQASMVLFSASYYLGIQTAKNAKTLSDQNLEKSELDIKEAISSTYYIILMYEKMLGIIDNNIANMNETFKSTQAMFSVGMAEATDVDQITSNLKMLEDSKSAMERSIELNYNILRLQTGVPADSKIKLAQSLDDFLSAVNVEALVSQDFDLKGNVNYKIIESTENLSSLNLKMKKASVLPTLSGFYNYGTNGMGDKIKEQRWFPNSMAGLSLSFPIFGSGQRYFGIRKAQIDLQRATSAKQIVVNTLSIQEKQYRYNLVNANLNFKTQQSNVDVARRVSDSMEKKFRQGVASSLELTQSNSIYLQAQNNYITALMNLLQSKLALDKLLNNL